MNISFFSLHFDLFSIIAKEVIQIRNNVLCVVARLVFLFCCALTTVRCNAFQHVFVNQKKSEFYGPYFQTILFLVTMIKLTCIKGREKNKTKIAKGRSLVYLVMFIKLVFGQNNIVCIGTLSILMVKIKHLSMF